MHRESDLFESKEAREGPASVLSLLGPTVRPLPLSRQIRHSSAWEEAARGIEVRQSTARLSAAATVRIMSKLT